MEIEITGVDHLDIKDFVRQSKDEDRITITNVRRTGSSWAISFTISKLSQKMRSYLNENNNYCYIHLCPRVSSTADSIHWSDHRRGRKIFHKYVTRHDLSWRIRVNQSSTDPYTVTVSDEDFIDRYDTDHHDFSKFDVTNWDYAYTRYVFKLGNSDISKFPSDDYGVKQKWWYSSLNSSELYVYLNFTT